MKGCDSVFYCLLSNATRRTLRCCGLGRSIRLRDIRFKQYRVLVKSEVGEELFPSEEEVG